MTFDRICNQCGAEFSVENSLEEGYNAEYTCPRCQAKDTSSISTALNEEAWTDEQE